MEEIKDQAERVECRVKELTQQHQWWEQAARELAKMEIYLGAPAL